MLKDNFILMDIYYSRKVSALLAEIFSSCHKNLLTLPPEDQHQPPSLLEF